LGNIKPDPRPVSITTLKSKFLRPATTSNFECWIAPPQKVIDWFKAKSAAKFDFEWNNETLELINLNCIEATLPGSTFATTEINDDYTGVTERLPYRRQYDDRSDFTFIVDNSVDSGASNGNNLNNYRVIKFFELWKQYIAGEAISEGLYDPNYFYRMNYPDDYMAKQIIIDKFEKDYKSALRYSFLNAYPLAINSMPVSYESTQVLQCTVSFSYIRYAVTTKTLSGIPSTQDNFPAPPITSPYSEPVFPAPPTTTPQL
jgi:hypothetical protein